MVILDKTEIMVCSPEGGALVAASFALGLIGFALFMVGIVKARRFAMPMIAVGGILIAVSMVGDFVFSTMKTGTGRCEPSHD